MTSKRILLTFLLLNIFVIFYGYVSGFGKSLWLDELMSINFARELPNLNLREIFTQDPNAPFFYIFLYVAELILKAFNININENINLIRAFNLIGFIPIFLSYKILKNEKIQIDINIVFLLLISSNYFIYYILDIRPYFLLLSFAFLIGVINLTDTLETKHKYLFIFSSIFVSVFHIYGLTLSMSILFYRLILNLYQKNYYKLKIDIYFIILILLIFLSSYFLQISNPEIMSGLSYLKFQLWFVRAFMTWTLNAVIFLFFASILILFFNIRKSPNIHYFINLFVNKSYLNILGQIAPVVILFSVILLVSLLITPIIHFRHLIIIYPSLVIICGLLAHILFKNNQLKILLFIFLTIITFVNINFYLKNIINSEQNIEWVVKKTFTKNCKGSDVYFNNDGRKDMLGFVNPIVRMYSKNLRPIKPLSELNLSNYQVNRKNNKNCNVLIFSFHTYNLEKNLKNLNFKNLKLNIKYAPKVINKETSKAGAIVLLEKNSGLIN